MSKMFVRPTGEFCPAHPIDGPLPPEGGRWTADQFTFRRLRDGDIVEVAAAIDEPFVEEPPPANPAPRARGKRAAAE